MATRSASALRGEAASLPPTTRAAASRRTRDALPLVAFAALLGTFWWFGFYRPAREYSFAAADLFLYHVPMQETVAATWRAGRIPLWNSAQACGIPLLATQQVGALYPPHALYLLMPATVGLAVQSLLHLLLAGIATYALARALALNRIASFVAAVVFALSNYLIAYAFTPNYQEAAAWLPVGLLALVRLRDRRTFGWFACWSAAEAAPLLAGHIQLWVLFNYAWAATTIALVLHAAWRDGLAPAARLAGVIAGGAIVGLALTAMQLLPGIELARQSIRPMQALSWREVNPYGSYPADMVHRALFGYIRLTPDYLGLVGVMLIPVALAVRGRRLLATGVLLGGAIPFVITLGPITPLYRLYLIAPGVAMFRFPNRMQVFCVLAVALLAAIAVDGVVAAGPRPRRSRVPLVVLALTALLATGYAIHQRQAPTLPLVTLLLALVGLALRAGSPPIVALVLLALIAGDQFSGLKNVALTPYHPAGRALLGRYVRPLQALLAKEDPMARFVILGPSLAPDFHPKVATRVGRDALDDYEPMVTTRQVNVLAPPEPGKPAPIVRRSTGSAENVPRPFLDLTGTRMVVLVSGKTRSAIVDDSIRGMKLRGMMAPSPDFSAPKNGAPIYENPDALPRAFAVYDWRVIEDPDAALAAVASAAVPVATTAVLEEHPPADLGPPTPDVPAAPVAIRHYAPESVELETTVERPALLVLTDTFYPGWEATVDGRSTPVLRVDYLFRAVPVAAGHHTVRFTYRPASVRVGAACTGVALLTLAAMGVASWRRRRRQST